MNHLCSHCHSAPATHFCAQCIRSKYCSAQCQSKAWKKHHFVSCRPFYFIAGQEKRSEPSLSDEELESKFREMLADGAPVDEIESVFGQMSEEFRNRNESRLPCHEEEDPISRESIVDLQPDNRIYLMIGAIKYCFAVDGLYMIIRDNPRANNPLTRAPLTDVEYAKIQEAAAARKRAEEIRFYEEGNGGSFYNLLYTYRAVVYWDRIPYDKMSPKYMAGYFKSIENIKQVKSASEAFVNYISTNRDFWYWFFRDVLKERHEDESEDLIALGLSQVRNHFKAFLDLDDEDLVYLEQIPEGTYSLQVVEFDPTYWDYITLYPQLEYLYMLDLRLTSIPSSFGNLVNLIHLDLSRNFVKSLPREIGNLASLQVLNLVGNDLREIPPELGNLSQLRELLLADNKNLTEIPPELGNLVNLERLWLDGNNLTRLPRELGNLSKLNTLQLNFNQLTEIPEEFRNLTNLNGLYIFGNNLSGATQTEILDMFSNQETVIYF